ncbi:conserved hypothetical protein, partial [Ricinus communis]
SVPDRRSLHHPARRRAAGDFRVQRATAGRKRRHRGLEDQGRPPPHSAGGRHGLQAAAGCRSGRTARRRRRTGRHPDHHRRRRTPEPRPGAPVQRTRGAHRAGGRPGSAVPAPALRGRGAP